MIEVPDTPGTEATAKNMPRKERVILEARERWRRCEEWEGNFRTNFLNDLRFRHGDSYNGYQWPNAVKATRDAAQKPCLTMNIVRQHNLIIANEGRKNKSSMKFIGTGNGASVESAKVMQDLKSHIEYQSRAQLAYTLARNFQIDAGKGWLRLVTDYGPGDTFDQEIYIKPVPDPLSVYCDPDCEMPDKSDKRFLFNFDQVPRDQFREAYPKIHSLLGEMPLGIGAVPNQWQRKNEIWVCEYFRKVPKKETLVSFVHLGERKIIKKSLLPVSIQAKILGDPQTRTRIQLIDEVEWFLIVGDQIVDETLWATDDIPFTPVMGEEIIVDGMMDCKGHTRAMIDGQRMFNYNTSAGVEFGALQGKTPWVAPVKAIEELESYWNTANTTNHSVLPYVHIDDEGQPIPAPQRTEPPQTSPVYQSGASDAFNWMMMTSGQWQNQMGMGGNERTGEAIRQRKGQGDTATFHFQDNYENALIDLGKQIIKLIPKIYDTKRVLQAMGDDGVTYEITVDPSAREAYLEEQAQNGEIVRRTFNPQVGMYDIAATVGPDYASKRDETAEALTLLLTQAPALTGIIGDLLLNSLNFDKADEAAMRLKRMVPPQALGKGPSQNEQILTQQIQSLTEALTKSLEKQAKDQLKLVGKDQKRDIEVFNAETKRLDTLKDFLPTDPKELQKLVQELVENATENSLNPIIEANKDNIDDDGLEASQAANQAADFHPALGAKQASDGEWYVTDPTRKSKYMRLAPLAQLHKPNQVR